MSRLGKMAIDIPAKCEVTVDGRTVRVSAGDKTLEMTTRPEVSVSVDGDAKTVNVTVDESLQGSKEIRAYWGMTRALIANMVEGVTKGYEKKLKVNGVGYNAQMAGQALNLKLGFANTITVPIPMGVNVAVEGDFITVTGADKQAVGQFAAAVRSKRPPEPYNGKGIQYADEQIRRKQGKAFG
ncbi:MAG: 50S ribosomal protein L6 [Planctomycetota bacterium]